MKGLLRILGKERLWPLWVLLALGLLLLPRLGSYGFWEPQEMVIAARALPATEDQIAQKNAQEEKARKRDEARLTQQAKKAGLGETSPTDKALAEAAENRLNAKKKKEMRPPLSDAMVKRGIETLGVTELGARLPFVLLALLAGLATFFLGSRVRSPRAGLLAVLVLAACPLFIFQARQITSELGAMTGGALMLLGAVGLCSPRLEGRSPALYALDALWLVVGAGLAYYSSGFFVGVIAPVAAIATAATISAFVDTPGAEGNGSARIHMQVAAGVSVLAFVALGAYFTLDVFDWVEASDSEFSVFGKTFHSDGKYNPLLAGVWRQEGNLKFNFDSLFEHIGFGLFPWIALAPIAVVRMASGGERGTNPLGARMLFGWGAVAWLICTIAQRKIGPVQYTAVPAIAVAIAVWMDQLLDARKACDEGAASIPKSERGDLIARLAPPLVALFVLFAVLILAKDIKSFPGNFLGLHLDAKLPKFPEGVKLHKILMALGALFGLSLAAWLYLWRPRLSSDEEPSGAQKWLQLAGTWALVPTIGMSVVLSLFLSQVWTPGLSTKLSSRKTFAVFRSLHESGNKLGIMGKASDGAKFYAHAPFESLSGRNGLIAFLRSPERVFALVKASELCAIHKQSANQNFDYYVVDDSNADSVMLSNRMWNGNVPPPPALHGLMRDVLDRNPLSRYIVREKPKDIKTPLDINFDNKLQLIGIDMPEAVSRGSEFQMRLYYKVIKPIGRNFQVFMHFDGAGVRFQGDHWPVQKRCATNFWQPGAYVIDEFTVEAGTKSHSASTYQAWTGLFVGSAGNWENMKAVTGDPDDNNRVKVGTLRLK